MSSLSSSKPRVQIKQTSASTLGDFQIKERIGRGSFGSVFRAIRKATNKVYVLKQINVAILSTEEQKDAVKEVRLMAGLNHPNIVHYHDSFIVDGSLLNIVMGLCDGGDLQCFLQKRKGNKVPEPLVWHLFIQICNGMSYMHSKRILHRDLKTANIFLLSNADDSSRPKVKIGDLGVAKVLDNSSSFAQTMVGTPYYLSPELCEDKPYNNKSDVWALGCVLYELCSLTHPFLANNQGALILKIVRGKYPSLNSSDYSKSLIHLVTCLLSRSPMRRPTVSQVLDLEVVRSWAKKLGLKLPPIVFQSSGDGSSRIVGPSETINKMASSSSSTRSNEIEVLPVDQHKMISEGKTETITISEKPPRRPKSDKRRKIPIRNCRGNVRGTRVRKRGGQRVISSSSNRTAMRSFIQRTSSKDNSATLKGSISGGTDDTEYSNERNKEGICRNQGQKVTLIPPGLSNKSKFESNVVSRPTLAQLRARMSQRSAAAAAAASVSSSHEKIQEKEESEEKEGKVNREGKEEDAFDMDATSSTIIGPADEDEQYFYDLQDDEEEGGGEKYDQDDPPPLFVSHVDVLWRIDSVDSIKDNQDNEISVVNQWTVQEEENKGNSNTSIDCLEETQKVPPVAEELLNDLLDRSSELESKIEKNMQNCIQIFGSELNVVTIMSTLLNPIGEGEEEEEVEVEVEEGEKGGQVEAMGLKERLEMVHRLIPNSSREHATNALMSVIKLVTLRDERDDLEFAVREIYDEV